MNCLATLSIGVVLRCFTTVIHSVIAHYAYATKPSCVLKRDSVLKCLGLEVVAPRHEQNHITWSQARIKHIPADQCLRLRRKAARFGQVLRARVSYPFRRPFAID